MLPDTNRNVGAAATVGLHAGLVLAVLLLPGTDLPRRFQPPAMEVSFELLPEPDPEAPDPVDVQELAIPEPASPVRIVSAPNTQQQIPESGEVRPLEAIGPLQPLEGVAPTKGAAGLPASIKANTPPRPPSTENQADISPLGSRADWIEMPSADAMNSFYPIGAKGKNISGRAVLTCLIDAKHRTRKCRVVEEQPADYGFGYAALASARIFRIRAPTHAGKPRHDVWVRIPVSFNIKR